MKSDHILSVAWYCICLSNFWQARWMWSADTTWGPLRFVNTVGIKMSQWLDFSFWVRALSSNKHEGCKMHDRSDYGSDDFSISDWVEQDKFRIWNAAVQKELCHDTSCDLNLQLMAGDWWFFAPVLATFGLLVFFSYYCCSFWPL